MSASARTTNGIGINIMPLFVILMLPANKSNWSFWVQISIIWKRSKRIWFRQKPKQKNRIGWNPLLLPIWVTKSELRSMPLSVFQIYWPAKWTSAKKIRPSIPGLSLSTTTFCCNWSTTFWTSPRLKPVWWILRKTQWNWINFFRKSNPSFN